MREYSAISVSTADVGSLADKLTEHSRQGWELVEIVSAGDQVVAYLNREATGNQAAVGGYNTTSGSSQGANTAMNAPTPTPAGGYVAAETTVAAADNAGNVYVADETTATPATPDDNSPGWGQAAAGAATGVAGGVAAAGHQAGNTAAGAQAPSSDGDRGQSSQQSQQHGSDQGAAAGFAPAGWYADPAGRYDLRYWDGSQWTEHVARGGHQETDPPVR